MKNSFSTPAGKVALCGLLAALAMVVMALGTLIPVATYCAPLLAGLLILPVEQKCGRRYAFLWYCAVSLLSLLLAPDREAALIFLLLGYYPLLRPLLQRLPGPLSFLCKLVYFNASAAVVFLLLSVLGLPTFLSDFPDASGRLLLLLGFAFLAGLNLVFFLYDSLLPRLSRIFSV